MYHQITIIDGNHEIVSRENIYLIQRPSAKVNFAKDLIWEPLTFTILNMNESAFSSLSSLISGGERTKFPKLTTVITYCENDQPYEEWVLKDCFIQSYDFMINHQGFGTMTLSLRFHRAVYSNLYLEHIV